MVYKTISPDFVIGPWSSRTSNGQDKGFWGPMGGKWYVRSYLCLLHTFQKEAGAEEEISPELMRYLNRDFWEQKEKEKANAKESVNDQATKQKDVEETVNRMSSINVRNNEAITAEINMKSAGVVTKNDDELDEFVTTLKTQVEIFVNRMKSNSSRGRSIANDSSVQTLFMNTMAMHSQLLKHIQDQEDRRVYFEGLQDKLTQVKVSRVTLTLALRM